MVKAPPTDENDKETEIRNHATWFIHCVDFTQ